MLGSPIQIEHLLRQRLDQARAVWSKRCYVPRLAPELERDSFETWEEYATRLAERPWYVGEVELQKASYDIETGHFPLRLTTRQGWADGLFGSADALFLRLPRDQARALYQKGSVWPLYAHLSVQARQLTLLSMVLVNPEGELPIETGNTQNTKGLPLINDIYQDYGNGKILDIQTGLQWMRCALGQRWNGRTCVGNEERFRWDDMFQKVDIFNINGGFGGYSDWRVPTKKELLGLILIDHRPAINQEAFPNTPGYWFWSSSSDTYYSDLAWGVNFNSGYVGSHTKGHSFYVRLVRGGQ